MYIVKPDFLKDKNNYTLLDCRYIMTEPSEGHLIYEKSHIEGAVYVDLDQDLIGEHGEHGGRHPLEDLDIIKSRMEAKGVSDEKDVFIYDSGDMPMAAICWYVLQLLGKDAYVVEGGYDALVKAGFKETKEVPNIIPGKIRSEKRLHMRAYVDDAIRSIDDDKCVLVDARAFERYSGIEEPFDAYAGHIPNAKNIFWKSLLDEHSKVKSTEELEEIFSGLEAFDEVIFQCGSGITGAVNLLIYSHFGKKARLYSGSFSDYITYKGNKLIIKDGKEIIL